MGHPKITKLQQGGQGIRLATLVDDYLATKRAANLDPKSVTVYRETLDLFLAFLDQAQIAPYAASVTREHMQLFLEWDRARGCKDSTIYNHFIRLKIFWNWVTQEEPHLAHPMERMKAPKVAEQLTDPISDEDFQAMLKTCDGSDFRDRRDRAILLLAYDSGIRVAGLTHLQVEDIDLQHGEVAVKVAKGKKPYVTRFGETANTAIRRYLRSRAEHDAARDPALWLGNQGALTIRGMQDIIKRRAKKAGLNPAKYHIHLFRHTAAHNQKAAGLSDEDVMALFNWDDPKSAARYGKALRGKRARQHYVSPADRLGKMEK